jgi:tubulin polyglutamylase TTLL5
VANSSSAHLFHITPTTFLLPRELPAFREAFTRAAGGVEASCCQPAGLNLWITKPVGLSRGRGIALLSDLEQLPGLQAMAAEATAAVVATAQDGGGSSAAGSTAGQLLVQRYVAQPLLLQGYKFDLRVYVLVTGVQPLEAWLYREGLARFASRPYSLAAEALHDRPMHLTNYAVQRDARVAEGGGGAPGSLPPFLVQQEQQQQQQEGDMNLGPDCVSEGVDGSAANGSAAAAELYGGTKCSLGKLFSLLRPLGIERQDLWERVAEVATAALFAAQASMAPQPNSFELFGLDLLVDSRCRVWLLEVNSSPSMELDTALDRQLKPRLVRDMVRVLQLGGMDRAALGRVVAGRVAGRGRGRAGGALAGTAGVSRAQTAAEVAEVLGGSVPRQYGEPPRECGGFQCIAPSPFYRRLARLKAAGP